MTSTIVWTIIISWIILLICWWFIKSSQVKEYRDDEYRSAKVKLWLVFVLILTTLIPVINVIVAACVLGIAIWWLCANGDGQFYDISIRETSLMFRIIKFLNKGI